jgi:putative methionine-R-sulfoxide reductase with GAF domain
MRDEQVALGEIAAALASMNSSGNTGAAKSAAAKRIADAIRIEGGYGWVAVCQVLSADVELIGWTGTEAPAFIRFPATKGVTRDVIKTGAPIVISDVRKDARYLVAHSTTRSEMIVPVLGANGAVIGTVEVDSQRENAFGEADVRFLEHCADKMAPLFAGGNS